MSKVKLILGIFGALLFVGIIAVIFVFAPPSISSIAKFAQLKFPAGMKMTRSLDTGERIEAEFELNASLRQEFYKLNSFQVHDYVNGQVASICIGRHRIRSEAINETIERLEVAYPDHSGDSPCE